MLPLFDLHCDTFSELYITKQNFTNNSLHISLKNAANFNPYVQICAIWSDYRLDNDDAFLKCLDTVKYVKEHNIYTSTSLNEGIDKNFILSVEDARILNNDLSRLDTLYSLGVRVITLNWKDTSCIGGGWNTHIGLTDFGKSLIKRALELKMVIDLSHSSIEVFNEALNLTKNSYYPPIASHSNSYAICNNKRNLNDEQFTELCKRKSIVGISLVPEHLGENATIYSILKHIYHFLSIGGENILCLGCDFDGTHSLPVGIYNISDLSTVFSALNKEFGEKITKKIFFENAHSYFNKIL